MIIALLEKNCNRIFSDRGDILKSIMEGKNIVIAGAGFAGTAVLEYLKKIQKKYQLTITLVDKRDYFLFTPLLHEVSTGSLAASSVIESIHDIAGPDVRVLHNKIDHFYFADKQIHVNGQRIDYDILVLCLGSQTHFYETPGAEEHALPLKNMQHALDINHRVLDIFMQASKTEDSELRKELLNFSIVGGGATSVELATELAEWSHDLADYHGIPREDVTISLYNSKDRILPIFSTRASQYAKKVLEKRGVTVRCNTRVSSVRPGALVAEDTIIPTNMTVWAAGVKPVAGNCIPEPDLDAGFICADLDLQASSSKDVFVLGDMSLVMTEDKKGFPMTAQVARQEGLWAARNIERVMRGAKTKPFVYKHRGDLVSLGQGQAVADVFGLHFRGPLAWFMWRTVYLFNFHSWKKRISIMLGWTRELFRGRRTEKASL